MELGAIVIDSNNSEELSEFYKLLLGWVKEYQYFEGEKWITVKSDNGKGVPLVFQEVEEYKKPQLPAAEGDQQQMQHLDFYVQREELDDSIRHALSCGAVLADVQCTESWTVLLDPAGHPFCIIPLP